MKAAVYYQNGGPEVFRYEDVPTPVPQAGEVLLKIRSISIEGGDLIQRERRPLLHVPNIVGYQSAGDIVALGPGVSDRTVDQRVAAFGRSGSHAEYVAVPANRTFVLPDGLSYEVASVVPSIFFTSGECLFTFGGLQAGQHVLIHGGTGSLGMTAIQLAKKAGAVVITTGSGEAQLASLQDLGADHVINYQTSDFVAECLKITNNRGVNLVMDSVGGGKNLTRSMASIAYRGTVIFVGAVGRDDTLFDPLTLWPKSAALRGVSMFIIMDEEPERFQNVVSDYLQQVAAGKFKVLLDKSFPLSEAAAAHQYILDKKSTGRVLLIP